MPNGLPISTTILHLKREQRSYLTGGMLQLSAKLSQKEAELESLDPYSAIDPLHDDEINVLHQNDASISNETTRYFVSRCDDPDDDWEDENGSHISNIFDIRRCKLINIL